MTVELRSFATGKVVKLTPSQTMLFADELKATLKRPAGKGAAMSVAPDCAVLVRNGAKKTEYLVYGRSVLVHAKTRKSWQFYFGLLLIEWLS